MVSVGRWQAAQQYERAFWARSAVQIASGAVSQLDWYAWRAQRLVDWLERLGFPELTDGQTRVIEVGSGPVGIVGFVHGGTRVGVDPLESFYARDPVLTALRPPDVRYTEGVAERLPCTDASFDLAIVDNCIDHVRDVRAAMREIARVLRPGGILYFAVNCRTPWGFLVHRALSRLRIDAGHPHTFTPRRARALVTRAPFRLLWSEVEPAAEARRADRRSPSLKARMKALLGTSEFCTRLVAQRA